jgi:hypothetical protein
MRPPLRKNFARRTSSASWNRFASQPSRGFRLRPQHPSPTSCLTSGQLRSAWASVRTTCTGIKGNFLLLAGSGGSFCFHRRVWTNSSRASGINAPARRRTKKPALQRSVTRGNVLNGRQAHNVTRRWQSLSTKQFRKLLDAVLSEWPEASRE